MKNKLILILSILFLQSCKSGNEEQLIKIENKYTLSIPSFLTKVHNLNEDASLQYQHAWKEFYVIVIDESKAEMNNALIENSLTDLYSNDIQGYSTLILDIFQESIDSPTQSAIIDTVVNHMPARITSLSGTVDGIDAFYVIGIYEGQDTYYQVLAWTLNKNKSSYQSKMRNILYSLKEIKKM